MLTQEFILQLLGVSDLETSVTVIFRLFVAFIIGAVIGLERERYFKDMNAARAAGFRTYTLVCLGSAIFAIVSEYGFASHIPTTAGLVVDPGRVAAQVVTGIGFLGAGAIIMDKGRIKGLTTAAGIWLVAGLGLGAGSGLILYTIVAAIIAYIVLDFHRLFPSFYRRATKAPADLDPLDAEENEHP